MKRSTLTFWLFNVVCFGNGVRFVGAEFHWAVRPVILVVRQAERDTSATAHGRPAALVIRLGPVPIVRDAPDMPPSDPVFGRS